LSARKERGSGRSGSMVSMIWRVSGFKAAASVVKHGASRGRCAAYVIRSRRPGVGGSMCKAL